MNDLTELPEKWFIRRDHDNSSVLNSWCNANKIGIECHYTDAKGIICSDVNEYSWSGYRRRATLAPKGFIEITFAQFKKWVLKEGACEIFIPKVNGDEPFTILSYMGKDTKRIYQLDKKGIYENEHGPANIRALGHRYDIHSVMNAEGNTFFIGDKVTPCSKISPNKGKPFTITGFRFNNEKDNVCALTELHDPYGIGIDKIEHYVESIKVVKKTKKQETLLEKAIRLYPIGTVVNNVNVNGKLSSDFDKDFITDGVPYLSGGHILVKEKKDRFGFSRTLFNNAEWAKIIN